MTLTLIGTGKMSLALAKGLCKTYTLEIVGRTQEKAQSFIDDNAITNASAHCLDGFDVTNKDVILLVKPYALAPVAEKVQGKAHAIYSVLAGTPIKALRDISAEYYVRSMANVAASVGLSMTTLTGDEGAKQNAQDIFNAIGRTLWVGTEKELDVATGLAGSGPALLALAAEALADGAVKQGLKRPDAYILTHGLFDGFAKLLEGEHPALIKDAVMSPNGTTAAAYGALEDHGTRAAFIEAIQRAYQKTL